jgi:hypothetical protein
MMTRDELKARLFLRAALPLTKVVREDDKLMYTFTKNMKAVVQFMVKGTDVGAALVFADDKLEVFQGIHEKPTASFVFKDLATMNDFFAGKPAIPLLLDSKLLRLDVVLRTVPLLLSLKMLMPDADPKDPKKRALKVKLLLYMVTVALSQLNKSGDPDMKKMTEKSPDRVYQWVVEGGPSAFVRMKAGKTKAGKGVYKRRRPFVLMKFPDMEGAYQVLTSKAALVDAVKLGYVVTEGAMEYSKEIGLHMQRIEELMT